MKITHQERNRGCTTEVYPVIDGDERTIYYLRQRMGQGRGGPNEPSITSEWTAQELRNFAVEIIGLIAKDVRS